MRGASFRNRAGATLELESLLFGAEVAQSVSQPSGPVEGAWALDFPNLTSLLTPTGASTPARLRVCIATEDIVGPVRNGGIGTTYASLAEMLAQDGHDVTVLYLLGDFVEKGTIRESIDRYAARGVKFVPVPNYLAIDGIHDQDEPWLRVAYKMMRYLLDHAFDVVHVSEWRGPAYLSLLTKRQGLAFQDTLFVVKASSPWLWNRAYSSQVFDSLGDLKKVHAERRSIELADVVVSGSAHLLRWMASRGYRLPAERTFVQPNLLQFDELSGVVGPGRQVGKRIPVDEIVFFGRLERRKGLLTFCHAVDRLLRQDVKLPPKVSFVGKPGPPLDSWSGQSVLRFIAAQATRWPVRVEVHTGFDQRQAIAYLLGGNRLAVMPSLIENSSLAIYEALIYGIPFIASNAGGTPELVGHAYHQHVLCDPHPIALASKLKDAINGGGQIAALSFDNDANVEVWRRFHRALADGLARELAKPAEKPGADRLAPVRHDSPSVAVCIYHAGEIGALSVTLDSIGRQDVRVEEVLVAVDSPTSDTSNAVGALARASRLPCRVIDTADCDVGLSFNRLAEASRCDFLLFVWEGTELRPSALRIFARVAAKTSAEVVNCFFRVVEQAVDDKPQSLRAVIPGGSADKIFPTTLDAQPLYVARQAFLRLGGFTTDYRVLGYDREFLMDAQESGLRCETVVFDLASVPALRQEWLRDRGYNESARQFRAVRPHLARAPMAFQEVLLFANGVNQKLARRGLLDYAAAILQLEIDWATRGATAVVRRLRRLGKGRAQRVSASGPPTGAWEGLVRVLDAEGTTPGGRRSDRDESSQSQS